MLAAFSRLKAAFSDRILLALVNHCFPGIGNSKASASSNFVMAEPAVVPAKDKHTATVIFLHGLGDTGYGWSEAFAEEMRLDHVKYICPHARLRSVTLNMGMVMPAWFDIFGLTPDAQEDEDGINESTKIVHSIIDEEVRSGVPSERIMIGGFSMGGALALYAGFTYDKPLGGIIGLSSFLIQRAKLPGNNAANKEVNIFMGHGEMDFLVPQNFGRLTETYIKSFNPNIQFKSYSGMAHCSSSAEMGDVKQFLLKQIPKI